jgi:hypothetical protein
MYYNSSSKQIIIKIEKCFNLNFNKSTILLIPLNNITLIKYSRLYTTHYTNNTDTTRSSSKKNLKFFDHSLNWTISKTQKKNIEFEFYLPLKFKKYLKNSFHLLKNFHLFDDICICSAMMIIIF